MKTKDSPHRVVTDAKHCAGGPFFWTEVVFRSKEEIKAFIAALRTLLQSRGEECHIHIADVHLAKNGPASSAEIIFYGPAHFRSNESAKLRAKRIRSAGRLLKASKEV